MAFVATVCGCRVGRTEQLPQTYERQDRAAQVRETEQGGRTLRDTRHGGNVNDLQDVLGGQRV